MQQNGSSWVRRWPRVPGCYWLFEPESGDVAMVEARLGRDRRIVILWPGLDMAYTKEDWCVMGRPEYFSAAPISIPSPPNHGAARKVIDFTNEAA